MNKPLVEGVDYYWEEINGVKFKVFTEAYLLKKGYCCGDGCRHCAYSKSNKSKKKK